MKKALMDRVKLAVDQDARVIVHKNNMNESEGFTEAHFAELGLSKNDLKRLQRYGIAVKGYLRTKDGYHRGLTYHNRWMLIVSGDVNA